MPYGLYISAEGALVQSQRMEAIANNLANVDAAGFKRDLAVFQARYAEAELQGKAPSDERLENLGGGVSLYGTLTDYSSGPIKETGLPTDVAILGDGFFMVEKQGRKYLTRAGNFMLASNGALVTQQGYSVLDDAGNPVVIDPAAGPWSITSSGTLIQQDTLINLALVRPPALDGLIKQGENLFALPPGVVPLPLDPAERRVAAGHLEQSGVRAVQEMTEMIETSRAFEANVNMLRLQDQALAGLIHRVLRA
ncbi:MAG: flagellar hook basal-body protein [Pirellulales bacterium]|nr:flagellar hook basal-body protein [Pirellulales bacterium]